MNPQSDLPLTFTISLKYSCGCAESWPVILPPPADDVSHTIAEPCVPESCGSCEARGRPCPDRELASVAYKPITFDDSPTVRKQYRRMSRA